MNFLMVLRNLGILLICESLTMLPSLFVAIYHKGSDANAFLYTIVATFLIGSVGLFIKPKSRNIYARDGFAIVAIGWLLISFFGSLPFVMSGAIPSFTDAYFEAVSGFTTTGASILKEVESLPMGILFWRSFTHWIGGMGVIVLTLAIIPSVGAGALQIMKAESPGPTPGKLVPKVRQTAKILYGIYIVFTIIEVILLMLAGMPLFDSLVNTFGTVGTGGFAVKNTSIGYYNSAAIDIIITVFMFICGANFALYYQALRGNIKGIFKDEEFRLYFFIVAAATLLITFNIKGTMFDSLGQSLRHSAFQVVSIITTTGYATTNFDNWPEFSKMILVLLMFIGGCAGSTSGSIKNIRILLLFKAMKRDLLRIIHPRAVYSVRFDGKGVKEETMSEVGCFFFMYILIFAMSVLVVSFDGKDMVSTFTAVAATLGNVGPGLSLVGPAGNFSEFSNLSKVVMSICMVLGRLEIYPILLLAVPTFWKKVNI